MPFESRDFFTRQENGARFLAVLFYFWVVVAAVAADLRRSRLFFELWRQNNGPVVILAPRARRFERRAPLGPLSVPTAAGRFEDFEARRNDARRRIKARSN